MEEWRGGGQGGKQERGVGRAQGSILFCTQGPFWHPFVFSMESVPGDSQAWIEFLYPVTLTFGSTFLIIAICVVSRMSSSMGRAAVHSAFAFDQSNPTTAKPVRNWLSKKPL